MNALLTWCQRNIERTPGAPRVTNFTRSWADGMAFVYLLHAFYPEYVRIATFQQMAPMQRHHGIYDLAYELGGIPKLLEAEDTIVIQDSLSIQTYLTGWIQKLDSSSVTVMGGLKGKGSTLPSKPPPAQPKISLSSTPLAQPPLPQTTLMACVRCGTQSLRSARFCTKCGNNLLEQANSPDLSPSPSTSKTPLLSPDQPQAPPPQRSWWSRLCGC